MTKGQETLMKIVKEAITEYDSRLEKLDGTRNSILIRNKTLLRRIKKDLNEITNLEQNELKNIIIELELPQKEQEEFYNFLSHIQILLKSNIENGTTFKISAEQLLYVDRFLAYVTEFMVQKEIKKRKNIEKIKELTEKSNKYHSLLQELVNEKNKNYIEDTELLTLIFNEREVAETTKRSILIDLMRYNQNIYQKNSNNVE